MLARAIFFHPYRLPDLVMSLRFDHNLDPRPDVTYVFHGPLDLDYDLLQFLTSQGIDVTGFQVLKDRDIWTPPGLDVDIYQFGAWISQQFVKLLALDFLADRHVAVLIQDCDVGYVKPMTWWQNNDIVIPVKPNESHSAEYYDYVHRFTGHARQTPHCFVTDIHPVRSQDWMALRDRLSQDHASWRHRLVQEFRQDVHKGPRILFSEYELLGNWALIQNPQTTLCSQTRFWLTDDFWDSLSQVQEVDVVVSTIDAFAVDQVPTLYDRITYWLTNKETHAIIAQTV